MSSPTESATAIGGDTSHAGFDTRPGDLVGDQQHFSDGLNDGEVGPSHDELSDQQLNRQTTEIQPEGDDAADEAIIGGAAEEEDPQQTSRSSTTTPELPPDREFGDGGSAPDPQDEHTQRAASSDLSAVQDDLDVGQYDFDVGQDDLDVRQDDLDVGQDDLDVGQDDLDVGQDDFDVGQNDLDVGQDDLDVGQDDLDVGQDDLDVRQDDLEVGQDDLDVRQDDLDVGQDDLDVGHDEGIPDSADDEPSRHDQTGADDDTVTVVTGLAANPDRDLQALGLEVSQHAPPGTADGSHYEKITLGGVHGVGRKHISLAVNQSAIEASARNKLPITEVKGLVTRVSRPTESSSHKTRTWYKNEHYVDKDSYSWKNMPLFDDHQRHLWTTEGAVRQTFKK